ncbi:hypothetical protein MP228_005329 [Amoeboaphelidium protococcarum]|nr:hypothetical protein MP228_005329 [Amoeboaphelidium protococcarum]
MAAEQSFYGVSLRSISLVTLSVQNSFLILMMRYSRTLPKPLYLSSTAVFMSELMKLIICVVVFIRLELQQMKRLSYETSLSTNNGNNNNGNSIGNGSGSAWRQRSSLYKLVRQWLSKLFSVESEAWKLAIPATLYTIQNNLQYLAVSNLDAATFQVTYQLKILTTALFSVLMLGRRLGGIQWVSLCILTFGVALVQMPSSSTSATAATDNSSKVQVGNKFIGLLAVLSACCLSGIAGVYFEKILKKPTAAQPSQQQHQVQNQQQYAFSNNSNNNKAHDSDDNVSNGMLSSQAASSVASSSQQSSRQQSPLSVTNQKLPPTIWERNIQLAFFSIIFALVGCYTKDGERISEDGFFQNYNFFTWLVITAQATGGLLVAMVVKYADNILKGFATSISIIISCVVSIFLFTDDAVDTGVMFILGCACVIYATWLYDSPLSKGIVDQKSILRGWIPNIKFA